MRDSWEVEITEEDIELINNINKKIVDVVAAGSGGSTGSSASTGSSTSAPPAPTPPPAGSGSGSGGSGGSGTGSGSSPTSLKPGTKTKPATSTPPSSPGGGGGSSTSGSGATGHSTASNRVRGIQNALRDSVQFVDSTYWVRTGNAFPTWETITKSKKWNDFSSVKSKIKKKWNRLSKEEISEFERGHLIGDEIDMDDYVAEKDKFFNKITVPDKDLVDLNIILALDASGSTGVDRQYPMSGVTFATKRALEELGVKHSLMVYDDSISLVDVDKKGLSSNAFPLMADYCGSGGNDEKSVLRVVEEIVKKNADYKNIVIIISDGGCDDVREYLERIRKQTKNDLSIYIFGYGVSFDSEYAGQLFGEEFTKSANNPEAFAEMMVSTLEKELRDALIQEGD